MVVIGTRRCREDLHPERLDPLGDLVAHRSERDDADRAPVQRTHRRGDLGRGPPVFGLREHGIIDPAQQRECQRESVFGDLRAADRSGRRHTHAPPHRRQKRTDRVAERAGHLHPLDGCAHLLKLVIGQGEPDELRGLREHAEQFRTAGDGAHDGSLRRGTDRFDVRVGKAPALGFLKDCERQRAFGHARQSTPCPSNRPARGSQVSGTGRVPPSPPARGTW